MPVDITLLGATGYTGALTADYLSTHLPTGATWAIAGRNAAKLEAESRRLVAQGGSEPDITVVDTGDAAGMRAMAEGTRVLITTVGPYLQHGEAAVKAAAEAGIAYVDLTGEPLFVDRMWLKYHDIARSTGARIIHACGLDSIPFDLGVLYTVLQLPDDVPITVKGYMRGNLQPSGGTYHSAINQFAQLREGAKVAGERRSLEERPTDRRVRGAGKLGRTAHDKGWAVPLPTVDPQIVLRSARALDTYGPDFVYQHFAHVRTTRMLAAGAVGVGVLGAGAQIGPVRKLLLKAKDQGAGPTPEQREKAWVQVDFIAESKDVRLHTRVSGKDPGYGGTGKMLSEAALCLAFDDLPPVSGQTTTAVAMGQALIDRLHPDILRFETIDD